MRSIKVNADYEIMLFTNREGPKVVNESLEFLAFFLDSRPVFTTKQYRTEYLDYVASLTGRIPKTTSSGDYDYWWGECKDLSLEKELNSKEFSLAFNPDARIISDISELIDFDDKTYLAKNPFGMSGQNFHTFRKSEIEKLKPLLQKSHKLLIEPFFNRVKDFSHYVIDVNTEICYENLVDKNFQYKGSLFRDRSNPELESLSFYDDVSSVEWDRFQKKYKSIKEACRNKGVNGGYSVDSFIYMDKGLKVRAISEINYRKTMGYLAWSLSERLFPHNKWSLMILSKASPDQSFTVIKEQIASIPECLLLSPGDTRFNIFLLSAGNEDEGKNSFNKLKKLLPDGQLAVDI